jgi:large subunit ribosomal protein L21
MILENPMIAVVTAGGRQVQVSEGDTIDVDLLSAEVGSTVELDRVLMLRGEGDDIRIGAPYVDGAKVIAEVLSHGKGDKRDIYKYRRICRTRISRGFRPQHTTISIKQISA